MRTEDKVTRIQDNRHMEPSEHLRAHDRDLDGIEDDARARDLATNKRIDEVTIDLKGMKTILIGILGTTATASIIGALNLVFAHR